MDDENIEESEADLEDDFQVKEKKRRSEKTGKVAKFNKPEGSENIDDNVLRINKSSLWKYSTFVLLAIVIIGAFFMFKGTGKIIGTGNVIANPPQQLPGVGGKVEVSIDDDAVLGDENAPVTIIEFSDYECPFCGRFYSETLGQIDDKYIKTGKVKLVYRDFPLSFHPNAQKAAEAAECAGEQGKYWEMHDKLFKNGVSGGIAGFKQYAKEIGFDSSKFDNCLDSGKMASEVQKDFNDGQSYGVQGTPAFFINGKLVSGAQPFSNFQQVIDGEL